MLGCSPIARWALGRGDKTVRRSRRRVEAAAVAAVRAACVVRSEGAGRPPLRRDARWNTEAKALSRLPLDDTYMCPIRRGMWAVSGGGGGGGMECFSIRAVDFIQSTSGVRGVSSFSYFSFFFFSFSFPFPFPFFFLFLSPTGLMHARSVTRVPGGGGKRFDAAPQSAARRRRMCMYLDIYVRRRACETAISTPVYVSTASPVMSCAHTSAVAFPPSGLARAGRTDGRQRWLGLLTPD